MADAGLVQRSPLAASRRRGHLGRPGATGIVIAERVDLEVVTVAARRGRGAAVAAALRDALGLEPPVTPRRVGDDRLAILWAGEARWTIMAAGQTGGIEATLREKLAGVAAVTGQGDGRTVLRLTGPSVRDVLAKAVAIDLHPRVFRPGDVALTPAFHIAVHLWLADDRPAFDLSVATSYAATLLDWLITAGEEYGVDFNG